MPLLRNTISSGPDDHAAGSLPPASNAAMSPPRTSVPLSGFNPSSTFTAEAFDPAFAGIMRPISSFALPPTDTTSNCVPAAQSSTNRFACAT